MIYVYEIAKFVLLLFAGFQLIGDDPNVVMAMMMIVLSFSISLQKDIIIITAILAKLLEVKQNLNSEDKNGSRSR